MAFFPQSGQVGIRQVPSPMLSQGPVPGWNTRGSFMGQAAVQPMPAPAPAPQPPSPPVAQPIPQPVPVPVPVAPVAPAPTTIVTTSGGPNMLALGVDLGALGLAIVLAATSGK